MMFEKRFPLPALFLMALLTSLHGATQQKLEVGLPPEYNKWIDEDVRWIITAQEEREFLKLAADEQRDHFVVEFWERRNPNPGSRDNAFKEEHYRRLAFSNEHFAAKMPGWKTDRGHVYIAYGPPDSIIKHSSTGTNPAEELWSYRHTLRAGGDVSLQFVDRCGCGEYALKGNLPNDN
jgi:GWxTD domain-containing protein